MNGQVKGHQSQKKKKKSILFGAIKSSLNDLGLKRMKAYSHMTQYILYQILFSPLV